MFRFFIRWFKKFFKNEQHVENLDFLRSIAIFHGLKSRQLGRLMHAMQSRTYRSGEILFSEGQVGKALFIIKSGRVELTRKGTSGKSRVLGVLKASQVFGEMALLEQRPRTASAHVIEDGTIYLLYTATLENLMRRHPGIGFRVMRNIAIMLSALLRRTNQEFDKKIQIQ
jgi:CRP/FNR family transcriptional regulator